MTETAYDRLREALARHGSRVEDKGTNNFMAQCPAHEDRNPSLNVTGIEGQALAHCFAGCTNDAVLGALDWEPRDLFDNPKGVDYCYDDGRIVRRSPSKRFSQSGNLKSTPRLYRFRKVARAVAAGERVFLVEGEKDVHALESLGVVATTAPMGAGNFGKVDISPLQGADIVAVVDNDEPGRKWAAKVASKLDGVARSVEFAKAASGKDAADHVAAGLGLDEFVSEGHGAADESTSQTSQAPDDAVRTVRSVRNPEGDPEETHTSNGSHTDLSEWLQRNVRDGAWLDAQEFPPLRYAVPGLIPEGFTLLVGPPKAGKSWLALDLLLALSGAGQALGKVEVPEKQRVLYLALEDGDRRMQDRCQQLLDGSAIPERFHYLTRIQPGQIMETIDTWLALYPDTVLVVVDTLGKVMPHALMGESSYQRDYRVGSHLKRRADDHPGLAVVVLHHDRKAISDDFVDAVSGTHGLAGAADTIVVLARRRQETGGLLKVTGRDVMESEYAVELVGCKWTLSGDDLAAAAAEARNRAESTQLGDLSIQILEFIRSRADDVRAAEVAQHFPNVNVHEYLKRLTEAGRIAKPKRGFYRAAEPKAGKPICGVCGDEMDIYMVGQTTHPNCGPS